MASRPPQVGPLQEAFRFRPFPHWDPVPDWVLQHLDVRVLKQIAAVQMRFERTALEAQAKAMAEVEKLIQG
jgi:hypothetical protein